MNSKCLRHPCPRRICYAVAIAVAGAVWPCAVDAATSGNKPPASAGVAGSLVTDKITTDLLDYATLSHTLNIESLRAGSHVTKGANDYYFTVTMYALINTSEERNLELSKRQKVVETVGNFGETKIESLAYWRPDEKLKNFKEQRIEGNAIRDLAARAMQELKINESDLTVRVEIVMMRHAKRFIFFGEDQVIAKSSYDPIPPTKFDVPVRTNQTLTIASDDRSALVKLNVRYDSPATKAKISEPPPLSGGGNALSAKGGVTEPAAAASKPPPATGKP